MRSVRGEALAGPLRGTQGGLHWTNDGLFGPVEGWELVAPALPDGLPRPILPTTSTPSSHTQNPTLGGAP